MKGPALGAQPSVYLSVAPELEAVTGRYYDVLTETEPAPQALDPDAARRLWDASSSLLVGAASSHAGGGSTRRTLVPSALSCRSGEAWAAEAVTRQSLVSSLI